MSIYWVIELTNLGVHAACSPTRQGNNNLSIDNPDLNLNTNGQNVKMSTATVWIRVALTKLYFSMYSCDYIALSMCTWSMASIIVIVFPVPGGPKSTYGRGRHSPARILFTASFWGGFRSGLKKCPLVGMGLDVGAQSRYNYTFVNDDAGDVISQNTDKINMILKGDICTFSLCAFWLHVNGNAWHFSIFSGWCLFFFCFFLNIFTFD